MIAATDSSYVAFRHDGYHVVAMAYADVAPVVRAAPADAWLELPCAFRYDDDHIVEQMSIRAGDVVRVGVATYADHDEAMTSAQTIAAARAAHPEWFDLGGSR